MDLFKLPRVLGEYEGATVSVAIGRFGPYVRIDNQFVSLPKTENPLQVSLETAISLIEKKREEDRKKELKSFDEDPDLKVLNGRYGPYISYKKQNYKIPKKQDPMALTREDCLALIASEEGKGRSTRKSAVRNKKS